MLTKIHKVDEKEIYILQDKIFRNLPWILH